MEFITSFWLPILCSTVAVFIASWMVWMLLPHHHTDYRGFQNEETVIAAARGGIDGPGQYQFPWVERKAWCSRRWPTASSTAC